MGSICIAAPEQHDTARIHGAVPSTVSEKIPAMVSFQAKQFPGKLMGETILIAKGREKIGRGKYPQLLGVHVEEHLTARVFQW